MLWFTARFGVVQHAWSHLVFGRFKELFLGYSIKSCSKRAAKGVTFHSLVRVRFDSVDTTVVLNKLRITNNIESTYIIKTNTKINYPHNKSEYHHNTFQMQYDTGVKDQKV